MARALHYNQVTIAEARAALDRAGIAVRLPEETPS
jgi:hypothetical protein